MRTFVAINFPDSLKNEIQDIQNSLKSYVKVARWIRMDNFHLTIKFLGEIDERGKEFAIEAIQQACNGLKPFEINFDRIGYFGTYENMRVIWIGMNENADKLVSLQNRIEMSFSDYGFSSDEKGFKPHITIARDVIMTRKIDISSFAIKLDELYVNEVSLMLSENKGKGFYYTPLYTFKL
ncbi:MAG: RNA 2',3'-cyclic phosphodiesterase [Thermoanaerobacteraceae bacterium]|nr:RNA 2',3'-cyclic phosphodiesterase [Thermoanaerobacteraceae bacterium]